MREIKVKAVVEKDGKNFLSEAYVLGANGLPSVDEVLDDMEKCDCLLNESVNYCEGECRRFEDAKFVCWIQFTGMTEHKNRKEFYEGDIVQNRDRVWEIKYIDDFGEFCLVAGTHIQRLSHCSRSNHVIGNIYENPELLN